MFSFGKSYEGRQLNAVEVNFNLINDTFHLSWPENNHVVYKLCEKDIPKIGQELYITRNSD